jgi:hypothetical protein
MAGSSITWNGQVRFKVLMIAPPVILPTQVLPEWLYKQIISTFQHLQTAHKSNINGTKATTLDMYWKEGLLERLSPCFTGFFNNYITSKNEKNAQTSIVCALLLALHFLRKADYFFTPSYHSFTS